MASNFLYSCVCERESRYVLKSNASRVNDVRLYRLVSEYVLQQFNRHNDRESQIKNTFMKFKKEKNPSSLPTATNATTNTHSTKISEKLLNKGRRKYYWQLMCGCEVSQWFTYAAMQQENKPKKCNMMLGDSVPFRFHLLVARVFFHLVRLSFSCFKLWIKITKMQTHTILK